jgi:hypothetical protein
MKLSRAPDVDGSPEVDDPREHEDAGVGEVQLELEPSQVEIERDDVHVHGGERGGTERRLGAGRIGKDAEVAGILGESGSGGQNHQRAQSENQYLFIERNLLGHTRDAGRNGDQGATRLFPRGSFELGPNREHGRPVAYQSAASHDNDRLPAKGEQMVIVKSPGSCRCPLMPTSRSLGNDPLADGLQRRWRDRFADLLVPGA